ncbi:helix-turn-helix domain-containing protein [Sphingomonas sp. BK580]|uniref:winged helix-turn-helix transcriptional regulator n=1 Tax=Sphingomonas sp. BK580 TaxID=2586972 RepID=UPI001613F958|nr:helix-turn-helix domain-containing protein [Sphingomonas sp. BK580]MBB3691501.1 DNA-binding HxlR family transcriptional regulator [Sphingomonas sp. BK580]
MKLENVTKRPAARERWYDDACGTALAMELLGERWALLIVRELMFGPRRFTELRAGLPGISANVLTQRLERLAATAVVEKVELPGRATGYALTEWGYEAEPAIMTLGRWAARSPDHDPTLPLSAASMMMSLRTMVDLARAPGPMAIGFLFGRDSFVARLAHGALPIERAPAFGDAVFDTDPQTMAAIVYGKRPIAAAEAAGSLRFGGDRAAAEAFIDLFHLPAKATAAPAAG